METTYYLTDGGTLVFGRGGHAPSPPALVANVLLRLILCPIAVMLTWVPLRMMWRNGEFPACVFVLCTWVMMLFVFVNAAIWHNQDFDSWWLGYGWCDLQAYVGYALTTAYSTCVCAIMQRLSSQVGLTRVSSLSSREKRRRLVVQATIIFALPLLQVAITIFVQGIRYAIVPATGCTNQYDATAVFLVFFILPPVLFTLVACFYTFQVYRKFREVDIDSRTALAGTNSVAFMRRQRARRKLYFMVICILIPFTPVVTACCAVNIIAGWPWNYPSDFYSNHVNGPNPWNSVALLGYADVNFLSINLGWIPVVSAYIAFIFFGTSKEAINVYRAYLLALGLGRLFPSLHRPYDPDRSGSTSLMDSTASTAATQLTTLTSLRKCSIGPQSFSPRSPGLSETGSQSNFLAAVVSRDNDDDGGNVLQRPPQSLLRRWYAKAQTVSFAPQRDIGGEMGLGQGLAASSQPPPPPPTRTPFNPGLNWLAPLTAGGSSASAPKWKPVVFGQQRTRQETEASGPARSDFPAAPSSSASTAPILPTSHARNTGGTISPRPQASSSSPFDGNTSLGARAVSTHVWSDGEDSTSSAAASAAGSDGRRATVPRCHDADGPEHGASQPRGVVHVERSITSQVNP